MENKDLSKPFFNTWREGNLLKWESNQPNDIIGDFAFEWDLYGYQRKKWQEYIAELGKLGTKGDLVYTSGSMIYNKEFDEPNNSKLSSYKYMLFDISK